MICARRWSDGTLEPMAHPDAAHQAITAELVRLTLGGKPGRPELVLELPD